jgi:hypothetical protein
MTLKNCIFWMLLNITAAFDTVLAQKNSSDIPAGTVVFSDDFSKPLNSNSWLSELESIEGSRVFTQNGKLIIDASAGVTVWYKKPLQGNLTIEYNWTVLLDSGRNDRLSDLNQFWMAMDPNRADLFTRTGKFEKYDSLQLYYVGFGGNRNTTTRFRKYLGDGRKPVLKEYLDAPHLLVANHPYHIVISVKNGRTSFSVDGEVLFDFADPNPLKYGYFGFRSTQARHAIDHFRIISHP